jgi:hypothetical protein
MATPPRIGSLKIEVDGRWDLADLQKFSESLLEAYGFLYHVLEDENSSLRLRDSKFVFELDDDFDFFPWGRLFYQDISPPQRIKIRSFHYSSPGLIEIVGVLGALALAARVVRAWVSTGEAILGLLDKITKFLYERRRRRLERQRARDDDEGTALHFVFEFGGSLGFDQRFLDTLIQVAGSPMGALKLLVGVARPGKRMAELQQEGKLVFPETIGEKRQLPSPRKVSREARKRPQRRENEEE